MSLSTLREIGAPETQGTVLITYKKSFPSPLPGSARTRPRRKQEKEQQPLFYCIRIIREPYVKRLSRHILTLRVPVFHGPPDNGSAPLPAWALSLFMETFPTSSFLFFPILFPACSGLFFCCTRIFPLFSLLSYPRNTKALPDVSPVQAVF